MLRVFFLRADGIIWNYLLEDDRKLSYKRAFKQKADKLGFA